MEINLKYVSSNMDGAFILKIQEKTYVFNFFEGFQRCCIENSIALGTIDVIFSLEKDNLAGLIGYYLTMGDCKKSYCDLVYNFNIHLPTIFKIAYRPQFQFWNSNQTNYDDKYICVFLDSLEDYTNCYIQFKKIPGKVCIDKLPVNFPKKYIKDLKAKKSININGNIYNGANFTEDDIFLNNIYIIRGTKYSINYVKTAQLIFYRNFNTLLECKTINPTAEYWYLSLNTNIEYKSQYNLLKELNSIILPISFKSINIVQSINHLDCCVYNKQTSSLIFEKSKDVQIQNITQNVFPHNYLLFLGTGCAIPSKEKNVASLLYFNNNYGILFDCGEDTIGQIKRIYSNISILNQIYIIFISHSHPDHMLGIVAILKSSQHCITIIGSTILDNYLQIFNVKYKFVNVSTNNYFVIDNIKFTIAKSEHFKDSVFCAIDHNGFKLSYSGDCRPSMTFANISLYNDVMIHECTFLDSQKDFALKTKHSTNTEAYEIFKASKSKKLILTHFSQRNKLDMWINEVLDDNVLLAHDFFIYSI